MNTCSYILRSQAWNHPPCVSNTPKLKRMIDVMLVSVSLLFLMAPILLIALLVKLTSKGPVLYWSDRVGKDNSIFSMPKFRTMKIGTPEVATHLLSESAQYLTPIGNILRKLSLDELPQLVSILRGEMSFVGPRPALFNQDDLIALRTEKGVQKIIPGLTGWAQINGRDDLAIPVKVAYDEFYLQNRSLLFDLKIIFLTAYKVIKREGIQK